MNAPLPPLANVYAFASLDASILEDMARRLEGDGRFAQVWRPHPQWVVGTAPLPHGEPDGDEVRRAGFAFVEGRDRLLRSAIPDRLGQLSRKVATAPATLDSLPGDFGFLRFDPDGSVQVVRSCGGLAPFYLWSDDNSVAVSTLLTDHARHLPGELHIDPLVHAIWARGWGASPDNRTFLTGIRLLPRGHVARIWPNGRSQWTKYWDPRPERLRRPTPAIAAEHASRLRTILVDSLDEDLHPDGGNLLSLSGGVDSSSLAALSAGTLGKSIATVSFVPPNDPLRSSQLAYIDPLLDELGVERRWYRLMLVSMLHEYLDFAPEAVVHVHHPVLCHLPEFQKETDIRVLFGGEFADEVCGERFTPPDWYAATSPWSLIRYWPEGPGGRRYPINWVQNRLDNLLRRQAIPSAMELPHFVRDELKEEYADWRAAEQRRYAADRRPWRHLARRVHAGQTWTEMNWEVTSLVGVRRSIPFVTRAVLELAFSCHPTEFIGPGKASKKILRRALVNDVPARNLQRPDKGTWEEDKSDLTFPWDRPLIDEMATLIGPEWMASPPTRVTPLECLQLKQLLRSSTTLVGLRAGRLTTTGQPGRG